MAVQTKDWSLLAKGISERTFFNHVLVNKCSVTYCNILSAIATRQDICRNLDYVIPANSYMT